MPKKRVVLQNLEQLAPLIGVIDKVLVDVLAARSAVSVEVGEFKDQEHQKTIRRDVEEKRLQAVAAYAQKVGLDPNLAKAIILQAIAESCRVQIEHKESQSIEKQLEWLDGESGARYVHLKQNLLDLTAVVAGDYETQYGPEAPSATKMYLDFEWAKILHEIGTMRDHGSLRVALDLGCATGRMSRLLSSSFEKVIGCDISSDMLEVAKGIKSDEAGVIEYRQLDIENGLSGISSGSIDLVIMNLGTASDVQEIKRVLASIHRVLADHGRFVLSFYNEAALLYHWFVPWPLSLRAKMNFHKKYLEVSVSGKTYFVYAQPYTVRDVGLLTKKAGLVISQSITYPTIGSILPDPVLGQKQVLESITTIDHKLALENVGAYILAIGSKR